MKFPWSRNEVRAGTTFTDSFIAALTAKADGAGLIASTATAALESCAGLVGRGFASAKVGGRDVLSGCAYTGHPRNGGPGLDPPGRGTVLR